EADAFGLRVPEHEPRRPHAGSVRILVPPGHARGPTSLTGKRQSRRTRAHAFIACHTALRWSDERLCDVFVNDRRIARDREAEGTLRLDFGKAFGQRAR